MKSDLAREDHQSGDSAVRRDVQSLIPALRGFSRFLTRNVNDADDLVQETLLKAIANSHRYTPNTHLKSWLFTIMRNSFYTNIVYRNREAPGGADCVSALPTSRPEQEWQIHQQEMRQALQELPPQQQEAVLLVCVFGVSYLEAADIFDCEVGTIKSRISRARKKLLAMMNGTSQEQHRRQGFPARQFAAQNLGGSGNSFF